MVWFYIKRAFLIIFVILNIVLILESKKESNIFYSQRPVVVESIEDDYPKFKNTNIRRANLIDKETGETYRKLIDKRTLNKPDLKIKVENIGVLTIFIFVYIFSTISSIYLIIQVCSHNEEDSFSWADVEQINKINKKIYKKLMLFFGYNQDILNKTFEFDDYTANRILKKSQIEILYYSYYKKLYYKIKDEES